MRTKGRMAFVIGACAVWGICSVLTGCHWFQKTNSTAHTTCPGCQLPPNTTYPEDTHEGVAADFVIEGPEQNPNAGAGPLPHELFPVSHPPYTVAPPDRLLIDAIRLIPRPPYRVEPLESLLIDVKGTLQKAPISGQFVITPEGKLNLGYDYGSIYVQGLTLEQIQEAIRRKLGGQLKNPQVRVALTQFRAQQQIRGEHLVRPDGTVSLGMYGCVYVAGMTIGQVKTVVEKHLSHYFLNPQVSVDVLGYNSKFLLCHC